MTAVLWLYAAVGIGYSGVALRLDCRRSERLRAACQFNLPGVFVAVVVIAVVWPAPVGDDLLRWARRRRAALHRRRLVRKLKTQSVCTACKNRSTV